MKSIQKLLFFLCLLSFQHCNVNPVVSDQDEAEKAFVLSILSPFYQQQTVYVGRSTLGGSPTPIAGSTVIISNAEKEVRLADAGNGFYQDVDSKLTIEAGKRYELVVNLPGGKRLSAHTVVPKTFQIENFSDGDTVIFKDMEEAVFINWEYSGSALVYISQFSRQSRNTPFPLPDIILSNHATFRNKDRLTSPQNFSNDNRLIRGTAYVTALDTACSFYFFNNQGIGNADIAVHFDSLGLSPYSTNVQGGAGVFGSALIDSVALVVRPFHLNP